MNIAVKRSSIIILVLLVIIVVAGLMVPNDYSVTRSISIDAPINRVERYLVDLREWPNWSPWEHADPSIVVKRGSKVKGVGANQSWTGEQSNGRLEFTAVAPGLIEYDIYFEEDPEPAHAVLAYTSTDSGTVVEWTMSGKMGFPVIGGFFASMMDGWVGPMFEDGLQRLKTSVE